MSLKLGVRRQSDLLTHSMGSLDKLSAQVVVPESTPASAFSSCLGLNALTLLLMATLSSTLV